LFTVILLPAAQKSFDRLSRDIQRRIVAKLGELEASPRPFGVKRMFGGSDLWRVRVGDYRIVYEVRDRQLVVAVIRLGHRRDVYRGL
jgi:mRNA interferase RelE/StbE